MRSAEFVRGEMRGKMRISGRKEATLIRNALLFGAVIAVGGIAAFVQIDRKPASLVRSSKALASNPISFEPVPPGPIKQVHLDASAPIVGQQHDDTHKSLRHTGRKPDDSTVVVMVEDLPPIESPRETVGGSATEAWTAQGSAAPVPVSNPPISVAMSQTGGVSSPLTNPTGTLALNSFNPAGIPPPATTGGGGTSLPAPPPHGGKPNLAPSHSGFVLLAGGETKSKLAVATAQLYDPAKNVFIATSSMSTARSEHTATVLPNGKFLIAGGNGADGAGLASAEIYDPQAGTFELTRSNMASRRAQHTATLISGCLCAADGKVLITGGVLGDQGPTVRSAELYDPSNETFTPTGPMISTRAMHSATLIQTGSLAGSVLVAGGRSDESGGQISSAEIYNPVTGQFTVTGSMSAPRQNHSATLLATGVVKSALAGDVLIAGGGDSSAATNKAEVFNPVTGKFSVVGTMTTARAMPSSILLANGKVLIAGGQTGDGTLLDSAELFDPATSAFAATATMSKPHSGAPAAPLENGSTLIAGGGSNVGDIYNFSTGKFSATGKMVTSVAESTSTLIR